MTTDKTLWLVNTRTCNLDCFYCYQGSHKWTWQESKGLKKMMSQDTVDQALPWALDWPQSGLRVNWYGGEPLLNYRVMAATMVEWSKAFRDAGKDLKWSVTTNGTMLDQAARDLLDTYDVGILLSMDGPPWIHDKQRHWYGGGPSWKDIPVDEILAWRPNIEIAWQLDPRNEFKPRDLDWMLARGFRRINFNLNWLENWSGDQRIMLQSFFRHVARRAIQSQRGKLFLHWSKGEGLEPYFRSDGPSDRAVQFSTNMMAKFHETFIKSAKPTQPCGTGLHMLALTPEGHLYPSQEMAFKAYEPEAAPGTDTYYRVGDIANTPVIDPKVQQEVSQIFNADMVIPEGFDCSNCVANPVSFGGCHCRYIGQDGHDPSHRHTVAPGWCQSMQSMMAGLHMGAAIERYVGLKMAQKLPGAPGGPQTSSPGHQGQPAPKRTGGHRPVHVGDVLREVRELRELMELSLRNSGTPELVALTKDPDV